MIVEFFFSPSSRYCYLAASQIPRIEASTGCQFDWRPVRGSQIRALRGHDPFAGVPVSGQYDWAYRECDARAWAEYYGIPYREPPGHTLDFDLLARAAAAGKLLGAAGSYGWALCVAAYGSEQWPVDREACLAVAQRVGLATSQVARLLDDPSVEDSLTETAHEAHARGAFGVPTLFFEGRLYWGNDRLVLLEHALQRAGKARSPTSGCG